jgi:hypothetical protein
VGDARSAAAAVEGVCVLGYSGGSGLGGVRVGMGCFQSTARRPRPGYEDPVGLASETACELLLLYLPLEEYSTVLYFISFHQVVHLIYAIDGRTGNSELVVLDV